MNKLYKEENIQAIGSAIREKGGTTSLLKVEDMAQAIADIPEPTGTEEIITNGTYNIASRKYVAVNVPQGIVPTGTLSITENGEYDISNYANAMVNVGVTPPTPVEPVERDTIVIPDPYNTGAKGTLTPVSEWTDNTHLVWNNTTKTNLDFNMGKCLKNLQNDTTIVIENVDFSEGSTQFTLANVNKYDTSSTYYRTGIVLMFNNCRFANFEQSYTFSVSSDTVKFIFNNCTFFTIKSGNSEFNNCQFGNQTWWSENYSAFSTMNVSKDMCNPMGRLTLNNCYLFDLETPQTTQGSEHLDGYQIARDSNDLHIYNCRFECNDMPYASQGGWSYNIYWEGVVNNSSIEYTICNGGGNYGVAIKTGSNQTFENNQISTYNNSNPFYGGAEYVTRTDAGFALTDKLYVSSVFEDDEHINIVCSNDTQTARTLTIKVNGTTTYTYNISAFPKRASAEASAVTEWADLPIDKVYTIDKTGVNYIQVYDSDTLIRTYGSGGGSAVIVPLSVTANGTYTAPQGVDGYSPVTVNTPGYLSKITMTFDEDTVCNSVTITHNLNTLNYYADVFIDEIPDPAPIPPTTYYLLSASSCAQANYVACRNINISGNLSSTILNETVSSTTFKIDVASTHYIAGHTYTFYFYAK